MDYVVCAADRYRLHVHAQGLSPAVPVSTDDTHLCCEIRCRMSLTAGVCWVTPVGFCSPMFLAIAWFVEVYSCTAILASTVVMIRQAKHAGTITDLGKHGDTWITCSDSPQCKTLLLQCSNLGKVQTVRPQASQQLNQGCTPSADIRTSASVSEAHHRQRGSVTHVVHTKCLNWCGISV